MTFVPEVYHIFTVVYFYWNFEWRGKKQPLHASFKRINEKKNNIWLLSLIVQTQLNKT